MKIIGGPGQPSVLAIAVTVAVTGMFPVFIAVNAPISREPLVPNPTLAVLVQLKVFPDNKSLVDPA